MKPEKKLIELKVKVIPRARENKIVGFHGDILKVKVSAPPVGGKANRALIELLAGALATHKGNIEIVRGFKSREKLIRVVGVDSQVLMNLPRRSQ